MHYTGQVYRPPVEEWTQLLEVTSGCSHNKCSFCSMYNKTDFAVSPLEDVEADLKEIKQRCKRPVDRIYLLNGDPFCLSTERLSKIADLIHEQLPGVKTITCYCSLKNLKNKTVDDLKFLKELGYDQLYVGIETGYGPALELINKGMTLAEYREELKKLKDSSLSYHAFLIMGIAGKGKAKKNAQDSAKLLNSYPPLSVSITPLDLTTESKLSLLRDQAKFKEATEREILEEEIYLLEALDLPDDTIFSSIHPSNLFNDKGTFGEKDRLIENISFILSHISTVILDNPNRKRLYALK
ncbi:MAG: radical SAM protein [Finegoldia sp.]|nr:radical SAM protein [Finegoldia sp.]